MVCHSLQHFPGCSCNCMWCGLLNAVYNSAEFKAQIYTSLKEKHSYLVLDVIVQCEEGHAALSWRKTFTHNMMFHQEVTRLSCDIDHLDGCTECYSKYVVGSRVIMKVFNWFSKLKTFFRISPRGKLIPDSHEKLLWTEFVQIWNEFSLWHNLWAAWLIY